MGGDPCYQAPAGNWAQPKEVRDPLLYQAVKVLLQSPEPLSHPTPTPTAPTSLVWRGGGTVHLWETWGTSLLTSNGRQSPQLGDVKCSQLWAVERAPSTAGASKAPLYVSGRAEAHLSLEDAPGGASSFRKWPQEMRLQHGRGPLPTPNPSKTQQSEACLRAHPGHNQTEGGHTPRERPGGDSRAQPSQPNPSGQGCRRRCPPGNLIFEPAGPTDPRKGKGTAPGWRGGRRKAPSTPNPSSKPPNMARGGSQNWSSGYSDCRPEEQATG